MKRREFLKTGSGAVVGAGMVLKSGLPLMAGQDRSRVVEVFHPGVVNDSRRLDVEAVGAMLKKGMERLTGSSDPWREFIDPSDRVGLKINTLGRPLLFTHHELIQAVADELLALGVEEQNIIIWDRYERHMQACKFSINRTGEGIQCYGTVTPDDRIIHSDLSVVYSSEDDDPSKREADGKASPLSKIFTQDCDKIINMAILKDHGYSGVTMCLKNLAYGLCENNSRFHGPKHIGPFIADFNTRRDVREKVVLHMIDGLEACFDQGPVPRNRLSFFEPQKIWLGTDPVALDAVGYGIIDRKRIEEGLDPLHKTGRPVDHIQLAAKKGAGIADLNRIQIDAIEI